jgi:hypothetical protein
MFTTGYRIRELIYRTSARTDHRMKLMIEGYIPRKVRQTNTFVVSVDPNHWDLCAHGPTAGSPYPSEHIGEPWTGIPANSPKAKGISEDIQPGDLVTARVKGDGYAGVWEFKERTLIQDQSDVPWTDREYHAVLHFRALHRDFDESYNPGFTDPKYTGRLQGTIINLPADDPPYKSDLLSKLLAEVNLKENAENRIRRELTRSVDVTIDSENAVPDIEQPSRAESNTTRIIRDTALVSELKEIYEYTCQVCGSRRRRGAKSGYAEGHHLRPLGRPHNGPDIEQNVLIVCPNHHADLDYGTLEIDPETLVINHGYDDAISGRTLRMAEKHSLEREYIRYHNEKIVDS